MQAIRTITSSNIIVKTARERIFGYLSIILRVLAVVMLIGAFISDLNPSRILTGAEGITMDLSLFTSGITGAIIDNLSHLFGRTTPTGTYIPGLLREGTFILLRVSSLGVFVGILTTALGSAMTLAGKKIKQAGGFVSIGGGIVMLVGLAGILLARSQVLDVVDIRVAPNLPLGIFVFFGFAIAATLLSVAIRIVMPKDRVYEYKKDFKIPEKYKLFLYALPIIILTFLISYLPLWGWRYAFFDVSIVEAPSRATFVGLRWFREVFGDASTRQVLLVVMRNTLVMSGLGIASSILPLLLAVFFSEIKIKFLGRFVQTFTTLPNFVSWVMVYAFAFTIFSTQGIFNNVFGGSTNHLTQSGPAVWFQMLGWGVWRSLGWSAIIYIAAITGIDQEMYEAASIDGARRFGKMIHITFPSLMPTFSVMLLLAFAGMLSNGLEQYFVFANALNRDHIRVLDLYVFQIGMGHGGESNAGLATVIGLMRTVISIALLFVANFTSKLIRGESII